MILKKLLVLGILIPILILAAPKVYARNLSGILHNEQGVLIPWNVICQKGSQYLLESCVTLLNPDGSLTAQGDTAVGCIRNGFVAAKLASQFLSFDQIKSALEFAAGATGCGGIVDLNQIQNSPDFQSLLAAVPGH
jgi:hypothetical protein